MLVWEYVKGNPLPSSGVGSPDDCSSSCSHNSNGQNGSFSEGALLRERIATNIGVAGDQELTSLAFNQNIVVTIPGNTRFYIVLQKGPSTGTPGTSLATTSAQTAANTCIPTLEELRELIQLRRELSEMYQTSGQATAAQQPQQ
jgi:hypothetical protein